MHQVDAQRLGRDHEQRHDHQDDGRRIQDAAQQQQQHVDAEHEGHRRDVHAHHLRGQQVGNVLGRNDVVQDQRAADHQAHRGRRLDAVEHDGAQRLDRQGSVEERRQHQGIGRGHRGGLGRRGRAAIDAVEQDHRHQERREGAHGQAGDLADRHHLVGGESPLVRDIGIHRHQYHAHQQSRHDAAQEQITDRGVRHQRVQHHRDRRRDDRADGRGRRGDRGRITARIAVALGHHLDDDLADTGSVGHGRARHAGEDQARDDVDMAQPALEAAHHANAETQQPLADGAGIHDVGRDDEQRHCQQHEAVVQAIADLLGRDAQILALDGQVDDGPDDDGVRDRRANGGQAEQHDQAHGEGERHVSGAASRCGSSSSLRKILRSRSV